MQLEIAAQLATKIRDGSYTHTIGTPDSLVLVGHSFGSLTSHAVIKKYPHLADAAILTGFAYGPGNDPKLALEAFAVRIAKLVNPARFSNLDTGYVFFADIFSHIQTFFQKPAYEVDAVEYANSIAAPLAVMEYFTTALDNPVAVEYEGAVLVTTGEFDVPACGGECYSTFAVQPLGTLFPKAGLVEAFIQPGAGHGVNLATNATGFYDRINDFLTRAGF